MEAIEPWHLVVVTIVAVILFFGWKQLPDMSRSLGRSLRIFKSEVKVTHCEVRDTVQGTVREAHAEFTEAVDAVRRPAPVAVQERHDVA